MTTVDQSLPLITIVTPTRNRGAMIAGAIESVLAQNYPRVEHIVVDAQSEDDTAAVLSRYPLVKVIREPDGGVYDGLNKGIRRAEGDVIGHLNSDDRYLPGALLAVGGRFADDPELDVVSGGATISAIGVNGERHVMRRFDAPDARLVSLATGTTGAPLPNARFFRRRVYDRVGLYDPSFVVAADRDFLVRVALAQPRQAGIKEVVYDYLAHENSLTLNRGGAAFVPSYFELLRLAERYMDQAGAPPELRHRCRELHREVVLSASITLLGAGNWPVFARIFWRGVRSGRLWPLRFAGELLRRGAARPMRRRRRQIS